MTEDTIKYNELAAYAPIIGLPAYLEAVKNLTFADNKPDGYLEAVATAVAI